LSPGNGQIIASWSAVEGALSYKLYWGMVSGNYSSEKVVSNGTSYTITGLENDRMYFAAVTAMDEDEESGFSIEQSATPNDDIQVPDAPTGVLANGLKSSIIVSWNASSGATSYTVYYGTSSGVYPNSKSAGSNQSLTITGLANGTKYYLVVTASNGAGESLYSDEEEATPQGDMVVTDARIYIDVDVDGYDIIHLEDGQMQVEHVNNDYPRDIVKVKVAKKVGSSYQELFQPYAAWLLPPWSGNFSTIFDTTLDEILPGEYQSIINVNKLEGRGCVTIYEMNDGSFEIHFDDDAAGHRGYGKYRLMFYYQYTTYDS
jgi:hypothetical protein